MGLDRSFLVPPLDAQRIGLAKDQVKVLDKYGGGFPANMEGLHQLHCLVCITPFSPEKEGARRSRC